VLTRQNIVNIECDDSHAIAAVTESGTRYEADVFISDLHPARTIELTDTPLLRNAYRKRIKSLPQTVGCFTVYLKFKQHNQKYMNSNFYGYDGDSPWNCEKYTEEEWPKGYLYMHFCDDDNHEYAKSGLIISYMQYDDVKKWEGTHVGHRGDDYEKFKTRKAEKLIADVEREFPELHDSIESYYTSTPLTYLDYTGTENGSMYGLAKDVSLGPAARVHHRTKIPNLFLAGQNINSHGIMGVLVGTLVTCGELIGSEEIIRQIRDNDK
jgi:all-trans-retinol 13,14-reductase